MLPLKCVIDDSACPLSKNIVCIACPTDEINPRIDRMGIFYSMITQDCPVHQVFEQLCSITANHAPNVYLIIDTIKSVIDKTGTVPNFWKSYEKFTKKKNKSFQLRKNCQYQYTHIDQQNEQKQLLVSAKCLLICVNNWFETGMDFAFGNEKAFQSAYQNTTLKYGCVAKMWNYLKMDILLEKFIRLAPIQLLKLSIKCGCSRIITSEDIKPIYYYHYFHGQLEPVLIEMAPKIVADNYIDYQKKMNELLTDIMRKSEKVNNIIETRSLYSYNESFTKKLLHKFISDKCNYVYIDNTEQILTRIPQTYIYPGQTIPITYHIDYPFRCILCDDKLTKTIIKLKSDGIMEVNVIDDTDNKLRLCHCCTMFVVNVVPDIPSMNITTLLNFRHHRMILTGINDYESLFGYFPRDIIRIIVGLMYS